MGYLRAGILDKRVAFTRRRPGADELGGRNADFEPLFDAWANVRPLTARELFTADHHVQVVDAVIELRITPHEALTASDRATVAGPQGGVYDLTGVIEQSGEGLKIFARRVDQPSQEEVTP